MRFTTLLLMRAEIFRCAAFTAICFIVTGCGGHGKSALLPSAPGSARTHADAAASYASLILGDGATAYYRLDDTGTAALDSGPNHFNGTVGSSVTESVAGLIMGTDTAMQFTGTKGLAGTVSVPRTSALEPAAKVTLEAWVRFSTIPTSWTCITSYGSDNAAAPYMLAFQYTGKPYASFSTSAGTLDVIAPTALAPNTTYHLVGTYDGTTGNLYVNGVLAATGTKSGTLNDYYGTYGFSIGNDAQQDDPPFNGTIDEVAVYAGTVLSAAQIQNHYTAGTTAATPPPTPTPIPTPTPMQSASYTTTILNDAPTAYYHLDDTATTANDASGHGLNGTIGSSIAKGITGLIPSMSDTAMTLPGQATSAGTIAFPSSSLLTPTSAVTIEAWLRFSAIPTAFTFVTGYGSDNSESPYGLAFQAGGKIAGQFALSSGSLEIGSSTNLAPNTTYYVVATYDGSTGRIYVNGTQTGSATKTGTFTNYQSAYGFSIGDDAQRVDPAFNGTVDEVAVYAGRALTPTQIQTHYNAGLNGGPPPTPTPTPGAGIDWPQSAFDLQRTGYNPNETKLGAANVSGLHALWPSAFSAGGEVGEPVYAANVAVNGSNLNLLVVNGASGHAYALNADTGSLVWTSPALGTSSNSCNGSSFTFGPYGAPALDRARNRVYLPDGAANVHAINLSTGAELSGWPISVASPANLNFIEAAVTYNPANGYLYAETSSTCDLSPWYGRIVAINTAGPSLLNTFYPTQGQSGGGIWGFGGASIDPATNNVFVATGNADTTTQPNQALDYAEQIVELSPDAGTVIAHSYATLPPGSDSDYGGTPMLFTPPGCNEMLAAVNKSGLFVLYDVSTINNGPKQTIQMSIATDNGDFIGIPAYDPATNDVYVGLPATEGIYRPGLGAFSLNNCMLNPTPVWNATFGEDGATTTDDTLRSQISIANGVVYVDDYNKGVAYAFNALSGAQLWSTTLSGMGVVGPIVVNGHLYTSDIKGQVRAWTP